MSKRDSQELDYLSLVKQARTLDVSGCAQRVRLALLADFATQHLAAILRVLFARQGVALDVYEGGYDAVDLEVLNPDSGLYRFAPDFVALLGATEKLSARFCETADRGRFVDETEARISGWWQTLKARIPATLIQGTFVLPLERVFGNYETKVPTSFGAVVEELNARLKAAARAHKHVLVHDTDFLAASVGRRHFVDERLWTLAKAPCRPEHLPALAQGLVDIVSSQRGRVVKCVVLDLDNTLWGGVIGDDGVEGIRIGGLGEGDAFSAFQRYLRELQRRGIILAVCSKNDHHNAIAPFQRHPEMVLKESDIAVFVANWDNKADNIRRIQATLNIGLDSMVFVDDNPFERNLVRELVPEIIVPEMPEDPALYVRALAALNLFETTSFSDEDQKRGALYREEAGRQLLRTQATSIEDYLRSLDMQIKLERFNPLNLPRIAQLIQRSNQFNLTTRRYSESVCETLMADGDGHFPFSLSLKDRFGDYGLISVVILKLAAREIDIDEYLMSCRVLQRGVESFAMNAIFELARRRGAERVRGRYLPSEKNGMVASFYRDFGFVEGDDGIWSLPVADYASRPAFITPICNDIG